MGCPDCDRTVLKEVESDSDDVAHMDGWFRFCCDDGIVYIHSMREDSSPFIQ